MITLSHKFKPLFGSDSRYYILTAGRSSGKSYSVTTFLCMLMAMESGHTILFTRYTLTSAHASIIPEFQRKIEELGLQDQFNINKTEIVNTVTGSKIMFKGILASSKMQTANMKSLSEVTTWVMDEAEELIDEEIFEKIDFSIRTKNNQNRIILIMNPTTKEHFVYTRFFVENGVNQGWSGTKGDTTYIHTSYLDNLKNISQSFIDGVEKMKIKNPIKYDHIIMGGWLDKAEGVIFNNWSIGEFNDELEYYYGSDWGFSNDPSTLTKVAIDSKRKIIYLDEKLYQPRLTTSELLSIFSQECGDSLIIADNSEPRLIDELSNNGLNIEPCTKGAGSVVEGITLMQDYELVVTSTSTNIIKELNNYVWSNKKAGVPVDMYNHALDGIRYIVSERVNGSNGVYCFG